MDGHSLGKALAVWAALFIFAGLVSGSVLTCAGSYIIETYDLNVSVTREPSE